jgi:glycerol-3-phosphate dehydrogenase
VRDTLSGATFDVHAKTTLVAAGPWADIFLEHAISRPASHKLMRSKGIHLLVPALTRQFALTMATPQGHFFVLPWRGHTLLGTTDTAFGGDPDTLGVSERDIAEFLAFINAYLPNAGLSRDKVEHFYAGLRPLVDDGSGDTYGASRRSELVDHGNDDGLHGLFSAIGGKWTTSRRLAETVVDRLVNALGIKARPCETARTPLPFSAEPDPVTAIRHEMALTLEDFVMRRADIGQFGPPVRETLEDVARQMASELNWSEERRQREIGALMSRYRTREAA